MDFETSIDLESTDLINEPNEGDGGFYQEQLLIDRPKRYMAVLGTLDGLIGTTVMYLMHLFPRFANEVLSDATHQTLFLSSLTKLDILTPWLICVAGLLLSQGCKGTLKTTGSFLREIDVKEQRSTLNERLNGVNVLEMEEEEERIRQASAPFLLAIYRIFLFETAAAIGLMVGSILGIFWIPYEYFHYWWHQVTYNDHGQNQSEEEIEDHWSDYEDMYFYGPAFITAVIWLAVASRLAYIASSESKACFKKVVQWFTLSIPLQICFFILLIFKIAIIIAYPLSNPRPFIIGMAVLTWIFGIWIRTLAIVSVYKIIGRLCQLRRGAEGNSVWEAVRKHGLCSWKVS